MQVFVVRLVEELEDELEEELEEELLDEEEVPELDELLDEDDGEDELELDEEDEEDDDEELLEDDEELEELLDDEELELDELDGEELELELDELDGEELELELDELDDDDEEEDDELDELLDDSYVKPFTSTAELLSGLTSSTSTVSAACGGVSQVTSESLTNVTFDAAEPPKFTEGVASKPDPVTVTGVPPETSPEPGETELIVGMESPHRMLLVICGTSHLAPRSRSFFREILINVESSDPHREINFFVDGFFTPHLLMGKRPHRVNFECRVHCRLLKVS